ncbi:MAG: diaminopimelate epimerase [Gammaproteobacteria bacterium]|nr:diaminopimelate epimerase [Gammaproteobacteria bacterium]|tara:strand:+ start:2588 stop:3349 length:762 start_codon:yes stop_codon:yes gene_type:complete
MNQDINFTKMNSQGNDFVIIDINNENFDETHENITKICSRKNIGCDQLLLINTSDITKVFCKIYNSDGTTACQCGNGLRAIMLYLNKKFSTIESTIVVCNKDYTAKIIDNDKISVDLGKPIFLSQDEHELKHNDYIGEIVNVGNKHFVIEGDTSDDIHSTFLSEFNFTFILGELDENNLLRIKVKERGAGWTKSCGSGAIAAVAYVIKHNPSLLHSPIKVEQEGGILEVHWDDMMSLKLVGPSEFEYDGVWNE